MAVKRFARGCSAQVEGIQDSVVLQRMGGKAVAERRGIALQMM